MIHVGTECGEVDNTASPVATSLTGFQDVRTASQAAGARVRETDGRCP